MAQDSQLHNFDDYANKLTSEMTIPLELAYKFQTPLPRWSYQSIQFPSALTKDSGVNLSIRVIQTKDKTCVFQTPASSLYSTLAAI
ncbi:MAG TPA: hypothetical protein VM260_19445 [Pirellula sp.]|nr:hypothetical protein [Pirellula sp.]